MKVKYIYLSILFTVLLTLDLSAQVDSVEGLDIRFEEMIEASNDFKEYKVIKKTDISALRNDAKSYAEFLNAEIQALQKTIDAQAISIDKLKVEVKNTDEELVNINAEKDSLSFMGVQTSKSVYHTFVWAVIALLTLLLLLFIFKFKSSNSLTKASKKQLKSTELELEELRKRSIEKEQKLGRQLQDERIKLAKLKAE